MADGVVSFLLQNLSQLLANEAKLLYGVEDKVQSLQSQLKTIDVLLKNMKSEKEIEQNFVSQIKMKAYEAEDVIDTFITTVTMHEKRSMLGRMVHCINHTKLLHHVAEKIVNIKVAIEEIHDNRKKYDIPEISDHQSSTSVIAEEKRERLLHQRRRDVEEKDVVGFVHDSEVVIKRLVEGGSQRKVVSIIGMGGLGKTTLARKVYKSNEVKEHFNCRAWVYVSNQCRAKDILLGLLKDLNPNTGYERKKRSKKKGNEHEEREIVMPEEFPRLSEDELKEVVLKCLKRERYLLVLDDLWKNQDWDEVQDAFPDNSQGSRILITSRLKEVALHTSQNQNPPYDLQFLTQEQSWDLFSKKVFRGEEFPSNLESLGKEIVKGCHGLPLSIVVLGELLANKEKSSREWSKVVAHVNWYVTQNETHPVKDIVLKLSYDNLPIRLKSCFLYLGIFPKDIEINVRQLLRQWVAEGFIQQTSSRDPYDVAEYYLQELIDRSLIQIARMKTSGGVKTCRIHDLLRDLCISESKEDKFFEVCTDENILVTTKPRRLSIHCSMSRYLSSSNNDHSCVRSLFSFDTNFKVGPNKWKWLSKNFRLIRVLDLTCDCWSKVPSSLGDFIHLRYLRIESQSIIRIPTSICDLQYLQTLDLRQPMNITSISFPGDIWRLKHLRHLYTDGAIMLRRHHSTSGGEVMWNLQTISIEPNTQTMSLIEKDMFRELRTLGLLIPSNSEENVSKVLLSLKQLSHLNKLQISIQTKDFGLRNVGSRGPQKELENLKLLSQLSLLTIFHVKDLQWWATSIPHSITKLTLKGIIYFNDVAVNALGNLSKLQILTLQGEIAYKGVFDLNGTRGFPQLQVFQMKHLAVLNWKLTKGAMPLLQSLVIDECFKLVSLPDELWSLMALKKVLVKNPSKKMASMLDNIEMKNRCEIELIVS